MNNTTIVFDREDNRTIINITAARLEMEISMFKSWLDYDEEILEILEKRRAVFIERSRGRNAQELEEYNSSFTGETELKFFIADLEFESNSYYEGELFTIGRSRRDFEEMVEAAIEEDLKEFDLGDVFKSESKEEFDLGDVFKSGSKEEFDLGDVFKSESKEEKELEIMKKELEILKKELEVINNL